MVPVRVRLPDGRVIMAHSDLLLAGGLRGGGPIALHRHRSLLSARHAYDGAIPSRFLSAKDVGTGERRGHPGDGGDATAGPVAAERR